MPTALHRTARRLTKKLGVHGSGLVLIAAIWTLVAIAALTLQLPVKDGAFLLHKSIPVVIDATMWLTAALGCLAAALDRNGPRRDGLALAFAVIPPMIRFGSYLVSWVVALIPGEPAGTPSGWYSAALYLCMVAIVWLVAAIPDESSRATQP